MMHIEGGASASAKPRLREALVDLLRAVLQQLHDEQSAPTVVESPYPAGWVRQQQEVLIAHRPKVWVAPLSISQAGCLDRFAHMSHVRQAINDDPDLKSRVDTLVGPWFSMNDRRLDLVVYQQLLDPLVVETGSYEFDESRFNAHYARLEAGLLATEIGIVDYLPLCGFEGSPEVVDVADGLSLARMSDRQLSEAVHHGAVPMERTISFGAIQVSRLNQWALGSTHVHRLRFGHNPVPEPTPPDLAGLGAIGDRLVMALRVVCGGSLAVTRCLRMQREQEFPVIDGTSAVLSRVTPVDLERPSVLTHDLVAPLQRIFARLGRAEVRRDHILALALRRLVFAGTRSDPVDRLIDLMIAAEGLFLKQGASEGASKASNLKGEPVAHAAAQLLADDQRLKHELGVDPGTPIDVYGLMKSCYRRRNAEMHADGDPTIFTISQLDGTTTSDIARAVTELDLVIRHSLWRTLESL